MIEKIFAVLVVFTTTVISSTGYAGIALLMAIESACIPLPSEIIMPFAGYLVSTGQFTLWGTAFAGAVGCVLGSVAAYWVGYFKGREFILKYGKYVLIAPQDVEWADRWFAKYGQAAIFFSRLLPVIRTFISLPAGIARMPFWPFVIWTFVGSLPWCYGLSYVGFILKENWPSLKPWFHKFDFAIAAVLLVVLIYWLKHHLAALKSSRGKTMRT